MNDERESLRNRILICTEKERGALLTVDRLEREKSNLIKREEKYLNSMETIERVFHTNDKIAKGILVEGLPTVNLQHNLE